MSLLTTETAPRRPKWQYPLQPVPPTPRILHFPRRPKATTHRRRPSSKTQSNKPTSRSRLESNKGKLEALFDQERTFSRETLPNFVLLDNNNGGAGKTTHRRTTRPDSVSEEVGSERKSEEKWRFQAEMLRAECNLLRMEREITNKKLERMKIQMETSLRSAVQALVSGRNKIHEGKDINMVLEEEINDLVQKLEKLGKCSRVKKIHFRKCSNFDQGLSVLKKKLEKVGGGSDETTLQTCGDHESIISSSGNFNVEILRRKMEDLSNGTLLESMRKEWKSMLSTPSKSFASSTSSTMKIEFQLSSQESTSQEENLCSGHCRVIIRRIMEQVQAEKDQWSQMQDMLGQVKEEMEELQVCREFWRDRALNSESQIQSLHSSVEEWRQKAIMHESKAKELQNLITRMTMPPEELERSKRGQTTNFGRSKVHSLDSPHPTEATDEMEKHVLICRMKENHHEQARDLRCRRQEILIDEPQKTHSRTKVFEKSKRLPFQDIGNSSSLIRKKLGDLKMLS